QSDGSVRFMASARLGRIRLAWEDMPPNWVIDHWFEHDRVFSAGPLRRLCARLVLTPDGSGCRGVYRVEVAPRGLLGRLVVDSGAFLRAAGRSADRLAGTAREFAAGARATAFDYAPPPVTPETARRVDAMVAAIEATPYGHGLARRLADHVLGAQEVDLWHLRPLRLARDWQVPARRAVEL